MADFVAVLKKTLDGLGETTPQMRARVYDKARSTIAAKLAAIDPPPPAAVAERQKRALEDAIATVERGYAKGAAADPLAELENIFSSIDRNRAQASHARPAAGSEPASPPSSPPPSPSPAKPEQPKAQPRESAFAPFAPAAERKAAPAPARREPPEEGAAPAPATPAPEADNARLPGDRRPYADDALRDDEAPQRKRGYGRLAAVAAVLLLAAGGAYAWYTGAGLNGTSGTATDTAAGPPTPAEEPPAEQPSAAGQPAAEPPADAATAPPAQPPANDAASAPEQPAKFTQRLLPDGKEIDPGPAGGESGIGEGTSIVALTTQPPPTPPAQDAAAAPGGGPADAAAPGTQAQQALPVGQKAIFYEQQTSAASGSTETGSIVWSLVEESPGGDAPPEPAIRAEATIPGKDVQLRMTIRRNADRTLPASHIIEMIFLTPDGFDGGGIDSVLRIAMKSTEQEAGSPLIGIPAKIADGFFLVALNDTKADEDANLTLLRKQDWMDIPVVYKSGRRALLTMEKGIPGEKVFDDALKAWQAKTSG